MFGGSFMVATALDLDAVAITSHGTASASGDSSGWSSVPNVACGDPDPARRIVIIAQAGREGVAQGPWTGATCDGIAMTAIPNTSGANGNSSCIAMFEIAQSLLPDPDVTDVDFALTASGNTWYKFLTCWRVLSYDTAQGQVVTTTAAGATIDASPAISSISANHGGITAFVHQGNAGDGMDNAGEHDFLLECTDSDKIHYGQTGGYTYYFTAAKVDGNSNASWQQRCTFVTTLGYGGCLCSAIWERFS